jgi:hypothetical protein
MKASVLCDIEFLYREMRDVNQFGNNRAIEWHRMYLAAKQRPSRMVFSMEDLVMKAATVIAVALAALSSFPGTAQQQEPTPQQQQTTPAQQTPATAAPGTQAQQSPANAQAAAAQLQPVTGELEGKLDSKSAKQGDSVIVKTKENVTFPGGSEIPKGSKLVGHVTNVQARGEGKENSQIAIQFDRAETKDGKNLAIESVIKSVSPAGGDSSMNSAPGNYGASPSSPGVPSGSASPSMSGSPGMNGSSSNQNTMSNNRPGLASNTTAQPGVTDQNTNSGAQTPGSIVARNGNVAIRTTSIPGVLLANNIDGLPFTNASGMLLGARRDVHLDGGTQMVLAIAAAPQGTGSGMNR